VVLSNHAVFAAKQQTSSARLPTTSLPGGYHIGIASCSLMQLTAGALRDSLQDLLEGYEAGDSGSTARAIAQVLWNCFSVMQFEMLSDAITNVALVRRSE
jgi:hypothetical protein